MLFKWLDALHALAARAGAMPHVAFNHPPEVTGAAVQNVHARGLAHCDIKPENIMLMEDGSVKLCDFGAAVAIDPTTGRVAAMPAEICNLETQIAPLLSTARRQDSDFSRSTTSAAERPSMAAMTPYSLRKVTQVRSSESGSAQPVHAAVPSWHCQLSAVLCRAECAPPSLRAASILRCND